MENNDKSNIYLSIFKRKGGEGVNTKINEKTDFFFEEKNFLEGEKILLSSKMNVEDEIILFTNKRVIILNKNSIISELDFVNIIDVKPAIQEEYNEGIRNTIDFTKIKIFMKDESISILKIESGEPYNGVFQMLHYISTQNKKQ
jgi:hypothetical protein